MKHLPLLLLNAAILGACARTEPADPTPGEDLEVAQPGISATGEDPTTEGSWEAGAQGQSQSVAFRGPNNDVLLTISCDVRGGLVVQRPGLVARGNLALMQLRTADVVRRLAVNAAAGPQPQVEARIPYNDQMIGGLMSFDEPLEVRYEGLETLVLPPNPMVGDLVRTCQQASAAAAEAAAQANQAQSANQSQAANQVQSANQGQSANQTEASQQQPGAQPAQTP